ncbi:ankyrin repeat domain-containing protein [Sphingosinicella sp. LHD-64]|uniref:ankyrin repeat domain-containing protein n=1 Tax=Sphingosinicella sp. LHD-64 TaxID=3072139 RepID=UPI00280DD670|nr:ankyrin repeat domain-containing protein [Sphingosinicella sp. LHD-64]MDQ8755286.1 ankyrin repeat domain-containing protein [Sphingosinicella sp. LHD-64]
MVSKTSLQESVRAFRWREIGEGLDARPDLIAVIDERGRNWLHHCCGSPIDGRDAADSIRTADLLLERGLGLNAPAFLEGEWQATPLWFAISRGRNLALAAHLLDLGANPNFCLFAAAWNHDREAIRLLLARGADIEEGAAIGETPLMGAVAWSRFDAAEELLIGGADPNFRNAKGVTALHMMLKKGSAPGHFAMFVRHGARGDIADAQGRTAADILRRKKDPAYRAIADQLARG